MHLAYLNLCMNSMTVGRVWTLKLKTIINDVLFISICTTFMNYLLLIVFVLFACITFILTPPFQSQYFILYTSYFFIFDCRFFVSYLILLEKFLLPVIKCTEHQWQQLHQNQLMGVYDTWHLLLLAALMTSKGIEIGGGSKMQPRGRR